ncbi:MAG: ATP cone domain-containing protein, partial [Thermofilum sp.]
MERWMAKKVRKRSGSLEDFDPRKIYSACIAAGAPEEIAGEIAREVEQRAYDGMTTDEIRRYVLVRLKELAPHAYEAWTFYDRVAKGRITFEEGKAVAVEKGRLYLGR